MSIIDDVCISIQEDDICKFGFYLQTIQIDNEFEIELLLNAIIKYDKFHWIHYYGTDQNSQNTIDKITLFAFKIDCFIFIVEMSKYWYFHWLFSSSIMNNALKSAQALANILQNNDFEVCKFKYKSKTALDFAFAKNDPSLEMLTWLIEDCKCDPNQKRLFVDDETTLGQILHKRFSIGTKKYLLKKGAKCKKIYKIITSDIERNTLVKWMKQKNWMDTLELLSLQTSKNLRANPKKPKSQFYKQIEFQNQLKENLQKNLLDETIAIVCEYSDNEPFDNEVKIHMFLE